MSFILLRMMSKCASQCFSGCFKQICEKKAKEDKQPMSQEEIVDAVGKKLDKIFSKMEEEYKIFEMVKESTEKSGNKLDFMEKREMHGEQGYLIHEVMRQIINTYVEWDISRSRNYFEGCVHNEYLRWVNSKGGRIQPNQYVWR